MYNYLGYLGGGEGTSVEILFEISPECRNTFFLPKSKIFRKFSRYFYTVTPKITFYCIFINKFHKNFEKSAQKFFPAPSAPRKTHFWRLWCRKCGEIPQFFRPECGKFTPPPLRGPPPPQTSLINTPCIFKRRHPPNSTTFRGSWKQNRKKIGKEIKAWLKIDTKYKVPTNQSFQFS